MTVSNQTLVRAFIQARMSSQRFPGKVLAPFKGQPLVRHVIERVGRGIANPSAVTVVTSRCESDDPLAAYLAVRDVDVFRGDLHDVFGRFRACLAERPCQWVLRISADSPLLSVTVLQDVLAARADDVDVVTTTQPRTFPQGQNAELIRAALFDAVPDADLSTGDREHVTPYFYAHAERFRIRNVVSAEPSRAVAGLAVDTVEDLRRLEAMTETELRALGVA